MYMYIRTVYYIYIAIKPCHETYVVLVTVKREKIFIN